MYRSIAHHIVLLLFVFSIMGPPLSQLVKSDINSIELAITEEEAKEKILLITSFVSPVLLSDVLGGVNSEYIEVHYSHNAEIILPPPEHLL